MTMDLARPFALVERELERWTAEGLRAELWLRDDDAHRPDAQLDQLLAALGRFNVPCLLAVVPGWCDSRLLDRLAGEPLVRIAVHGLTHQNNAAPGERAEEMALTLGLPRVRDRLGKAREQIVALFGEAAGACYVPPWNRIDERVAAELPALGFSAVSAFGPRRFASIPSLVECNAQVDLIDWKNGRRGRSADWIGEMLARELASARQEGGQPVGILTHHLAHDDTCWMVLDAVFQFFSRQDSVCWRDPSDLLKPRSGLGVGGSVRP